MGGNKPQSVANDPQLTLPWVIGEAVRLFWGVVWAEYDWFAGALCAVAGGP